MRWSRTEAILKSLKLSGGYSRLSDNALIIHRVAVIDVRPFTTESPFDVEFDVAFTSGIAAYPSKEVAEKLKDKSVLIPGKLLRVLVGRC